MNNLNYSILSNVHISKKPIPIVLYGVDTAAIKAEFKSAKKAVYDWAVADREGRATQEQVSAAFEAVKTIMAYYHDDDLASIRDGVLELKGVQTDEYARLDALAYTLRNRIGEYTLTLRLSTSEEDKAVNQQRLDALLTKIQETEVAMATLKAEGHRQRLAYRPTSDDRFRYSVEKFVADRIEDIQHMTADELDAARKQRAAQRRASRKAQKEAEKKIAALTPAEEQVNA